MLFIEKLKEAMRDKFEVNNNIMDNETLILSTILNPNYKFDYFHDDNEFDRVKEIVQSKIGTTTSPIQTSKVRKVRSIEKDEVQDYINEACLENAGLEEIIEYWKEAKNELKKLYELSEKYLYLIASSTSSERLFSDASGFYTSKRTRMSSEHLEESCVLHSWLINEGTGIFNDMVFE